MLYFSVAYLCYFKILLWLRKWKTSKWLHSWYLIRTNNKKKFIHIFDWRSPLPSFQVPGLGCLQGRINFLVSITELNIWPDLAWLRWWMIFYLMLLSWMFTQKTPRLWTVKMRLCESWSVPWMILWNVSPLLAPVC